MKRHTRSKRIQIPSEKEFYRRVSSSWSTMDRKRFVVPSFWRYYRVSTLKKIMELWKKEGPSPLWIVSINGRINGNNVNKTVLVFYIAVSLAPLPSFQSFVTFFSLSTTLYLRGIPLISRKHLNSFHCSFKFSHI